MLTTIMNDSEVGDDWIKEISRQNPTMELKDTNHFISTGPVRLCFCEALFEPRTPRNNQNGTPKYGTMALYTPYSNIQVMYDEYHRVLGQVMPEYYVAAVQGYPALNNPFHDQVGKLQYKGFTAGLLYCNHTSKFQPPIIDAQRNPVTDPKKVYPGVWAILVVNAYPYGKSPPQPQKGAAFGLQAVMLLGDDKPLAGGGVNAKDVFKNVKVTPPAINPATLAGMVAGNPVAAGPRGFRPQPPGPPPGTPAAAPPRTDMALPWDDEDISSLR